MSEYSAKPLVLTREKLDFLLAKLATVKQAFDDYSYNITAVVEFLTGKGNLVFELYDAMHEPVGLVALHGVIPKHLAWFWLAAWDKRLSDKVPFLSGFLGEWEQSLSLAKISASVLATNYGFIKMLDKLGFRREGVHRKETRFAGQLVDVWYFGRLREALAAQVAMPVPETVAAEA